MSFSLFLVFEGSSDLGPVPFCRVADEQLTRRVANFALDKASRTARALRLVDDDAASDADLEVDRLRAIVDVI
jgi:hypothetical protein